MQLKTAVQRDQRPGDFNAEITIKLPAEGIYVIAATSQESEASGKYTLRAVTK